MTLLVVRHLCKSFRRGHPVVHDVCLSVEQGEFVALMGPSGSGKTTLLRLIAGLEHPESGCVLMNDRDLTRVRPHDRDISMVFQNSALYPHMSVLRNLIFPLRMRGLTRTEGHRRAKEVAEMVQITHLLDRKPGELSGGERQRAAVARALVRRSACVLFDEPLSHLETELRDALRSEIQSLHRLLGFSAIWVTHDDAEAAAVGHRVLRMSLGRLQPSSDRD